MDFKSKLPENTKITVQYNEHYNGTTTEKTQSLRVKIDSVRLIKDYGLVKYGFHISKVINDYGKLFWFTFSFYRNGVIKDIGCLFRGRERLGLPPSYLGYGWFDQTIGDLKIIAIETPGGESINLRANHTGFQPQKIW